MPEQIRQISAHCLACNWQGNLAQCPQDWGHGAGKWPASVLCPACLKGRVVRGDPAEIFAPVPDLIVERANHAGTK